MSSRVLASAALLAAVAVGFTVAPGRAQAQLCGVRHHHPNTYAHVVVIIMENKSYGDVIGSSSTPYINTLARVCGSAVNYHALTHPSLPNYMGLVTGSVDRFNRSDCSPSPNCSAGRQSIFSQLRGRWRIFAESMPRPCARHDSGPYVVHHNPAPYLRNLRGVCSRADLPLRRFRLVGRFVLVIPNNDDNMHDGSRGRGDAWLRHFVPRVTHTRSYRRGRTAIFITWDESDGSSANHVPMVVLSRSTPHGRRVRATLNHYSALRTWQGMLGRRCIAWTCHVPNMRRAFRL